MSAGQTVLVSSNSIGYGLWDRRAGLRYKGRSLVGLLGQGWDEIRQCGTEGEQERILIVVRRSLMERRRTHNASCRFFDEVDG